MSVEAQVWDICSGYTLEVHLYILKTWGEIRFLQSNSIYLFQNAARIMRALFEVTLKKGWPIMASRLLNLSKTLDKRLWGFEHPLRQFTILPVEILNKLETRKLSMDKLREMDAKEIGRSLYS